MIGGVGEGGRGQGRVAPDEELLVGRACDTPLDDTGLVHCFQVLGTPELPSRVLLIGAALAPGELERFADRRHAATGLVPAGDDLFAWRPAPQALPEPWSEPVRLTARRIGEDLLTTLDTACDLLARRVDGFDHHGVGAGTAVPAVRFADPVQATAWLRRHLGVSLAAVRAGGRARWRSLATALTARLWVCAPTDAPRQWAIDLAEAGTRAAIEERQPRRLAGLLRLSARWFAARGDFVTADAHGVREWRVWKELDDTAGMIDTLWRRARIYREAGRGNRELDCHQRLLSLYRRTGDRFGAARAQISRGVALVVVGRDRDASDQLREAARATADLEGLPDVGPVELAAELETLGRAFWAIGSVGTARRHFSASLRLLVDEDERAADRVRALLATPAGRELPDA
ncbi:hypothetical protein [Actinosynnema sp. NPDC020468]|uniref:hypothetical protein n=1 Tax=Actinosynnema sp. NPDC020468 TaxID=3154488 RepID=UPI0033C524F0